MPPVSGTITTGNSNPFETWIVMIFSASLSLSSCRAYSSASASPPSAWLIRSVIQFTSASGDGPISRTAEPARSMICIRSAKWRSPSGSFARLRRKSHVG